MEIEKQKAIIEAILFAAGRVIKINELMGILELSSDDVVTIIDSMKEEYKNSDRGIEIIRVEDGYQLTTKKEMYEYLYPIFDKRSKPNLTQASMETLAIIAYNEPITVGQIDEVRGVSSRDMVRKLLFKGLIDIAGKSDLPGKPMLYKTTNKFLDYFNLSSKDELPEINMNEEISEEEKDLFISRYKEEKK